MAVINFKQVPNKYFKGKYLPVEGLMRPGNNIFQRDSVLTDMAELGTHDCVYTYSYFFYR